MRRGALAGALAVLALAPAAAQAEDPIRVFGSSGDEEGQFQRPRGIAVDANGYVYVADSDAHRVTKFAPDGKVARIIGNPEGDADFEELRDDELSSPIGVAVATDGTVVVADPRPTARPVHWSREDPPGGGPVAALAAGVRALDEMAAGPGPGRGMLSRL